MPALKSTRWIIQLLGAVSVLCLFVGITTSVVTVTPEAYAGAGLIVKVTFITAFVAALTNVVLAVQVVPFAQAGEEVAARRLRRLGLWLSLPQLLLFGTMALALSVWVWKELQTLH